MSIKNNQIELRTGYDKPMSIDPNYLSFVESKPTPKPIKKPFILQKDIILIFITLSTFLLFFVRFNLSVGIVAMLQDKELVYVNSTSNKTLSFNSSFNNTFLLNNLSHNSEIIRIYKKKFDWNETIQGLILSSYFYSYFLFQVPCGLLSEAFGSKWILFSGILIPGLASLLIPWATSFGYIFLIIIRIIMGAAHASIICSCYTLVSKWMSEREKLKSIILMNIGFEIGGMFTLFLSGFICANENLGWKYTFYLAGIISIIYCIPYVFYVYSDPKQSPKLTSYDRKLNESINAIVLSREEFSKRIKRVKPKLSIKILLTSSPVWASCFTKFFGEYGYYLIITKMPTYMNDIFKISLLNNGLFSALPYLGIIISKMICFKLTNSLQKKNLMSLTRLRILFQTISMITPAIFIFTVTVFNRNQYLVVFFIFLAMFGKGFTVGGDAPIVADFAKDLSGSVFGYTNMFACFNGILAPILSSKITEAFDDKILGWDINFYIVSIFFLFGNLMFCLLASAEPQPWAMEKFVEVPYSITEINRSDLEKNNNNNQSES